MENESLLKQADLNWCVDIFQRLDEILKKPNISLSDLSQIHWLVKQGLKVKKEDE